MVSISLEELKKWRSIIPLEEKVVVTNGVFDLVHRGHLLFLQEAKRLGDYLVVGINSDESVKKLKGASRPINNEQDRGFLVSSLRWVTLTYIFNGERCSEFLDVVKPDIYVKAGDYSLDSLHPSEKKILEKNGSRIIILPFEKGYSTTNIIKKINK